jgi:hypothetical protein
MRKAYWEYIEKIIVNIPDQEPDECRKKQPKNLFVSIENAFLNCSFSIYALALVLSV